MVFPPIQIKGTNSGCPFLFFYRVGLELDDAVKYAKQLDGLTDIAMVRIADSSAAHPTTWNIEKGKPYTIRYAEAIKKRGAKIITAPGGGYQNLDLIEGYIAEGKTGMITIARAGHSVTMLTGEDQIFPYYRGHYTISVEEAYKDLKNFSIITKGTAKSISAGNVTYADARGAEQSIQADDIVVYAGLKPKKDDALKFYGSAKQFFAIGDCSEIGGDTQKCIRSAFYAASQV